MATEEKVKTFVQRVAAKKKYKCEFGPGLSTSETIATRTVASVPSGLTLSSTIIGTDVIVLASGGTAGTEYQVTCVGVTNDGQEIPVVFMLEVIAN